MEAQKVRKKDLIGDIKDFPIEIVQAMVDEQVRQGNEANVEIFQKLRSSTRSRGGFDWCESSQGLAFWSEVIYDKAFDLFYK